MKELMAALIRARKKFNPLKMDKQGVRNDYASYGAICDAVEEPLNDEGLKMAFSPFSENGVNYLQMSIYHTESDQVYQGYQPLFDDPSSPIKDANQRYGAATTYAMRNLARTMLGLHADNNDLDDFGDEAPRGAPPISSKQLWLMKKILSEKENSQDVTQAILNRFGIDTLDDLSQKQASDIIEKLKG